MSSAVDDLLAILDLEQLEHNLFRGRSPQVGWQRVFGGQVIGQALVAACRTVDAEARPPHSLHAYFLLAGDPKVPIIYEVDRIRDGTQLRDPPRGRDPAWLARSSPCRPPSTPRSPASTMPRPCPHVPGPEELPSDARDQVRGAADHARSGARLFRARAADRAEAGRTQPLPVAGAAGSRSSTSGSARPGACRTTRRSINACSPTRPT